MIGKPEPLSAMRIDRLPASHPIDVALLFPSSGYLPVDDPLFGRIGNAFEVILQYAGPSGPSLPAITPASVPVDLGALPPGDYTFELLLYADGGLADTASGGFSVPEPPIWLLLLAGVALRCRRSGAPVGR